MFKPVLRSFVVVIAAALAVGQPVPASAGQPETKPAEQPSDRPVPPGGGRGGDRAQRPGGPGQNMSIEAAMKAMNRGIRQLRGQVADAAKKDDNLRIIGDMQRAAIAAKNQPLPPDMLRDAKDDAAKTKLAHDFRAGLITSVRAMLDLEEAVADGKGDLAKAKYDELLKIRDHGHETMGIHDEDEPTTGNEPGADKPKDAKPDGEKSKGNKGG